DAEFQWRCARRTLKGRGLRSTTGALFFWLATTRVASRYRTLRDGRSATTCRDILAERGKQPVQEVVFLHLRPTTEFAERAGPQGAQPPHDRALANREAERADGEGLTSQVVAHAEHELDAATLKGTAQRAADQ